jgi:hypothetical protein
MCGLRETGHNTHKVSDKSHAVQLPVHEACALCFRSDGRFAQELYACHKHECETRQRSTCRLGGAPSKPRTLLFSYFFRSSVRSLICIHGNISPRVLATLSGLPGMAALAATRGSILDSSSRGSPRASRETDTGSQVKRDTGPYPEANLRHEPLSCRIQCRSAFGVWQRQGQ